MHLDTFLNLKFYYVLYPSFSLSLSSFFPFFFCSFFCRFSKYFSSGRELESLSNNLTVYPHSTLPLTQLLVDKDPVEHCELEGYLETHIETYY